MAEEGIDPGDMTLIDEPHHGFGTWWLATAALVFLALWGWRELDIRRMRDLEETDRAEIRQLTVQNQDLNQRLERMLLSVASPETRTINLAGQQKAAGKVFVDPATHHAIVVLSNLPPNSASKNYQLWISSTAAPNPQSAMVFDVPASGSATLTIDDVPAAADIKSVGVTLETKGGAGAPHGQFVLAGKP